MVKGFVIERDGARNGRGVAARLLLLTTVLLLFTLTPGASSARADGEPLSGSSQLAWSLGRDGNTITAELPDTDGFKVEDTPQGQVIWVKGFLTGGAPGCPQLPAVTLRFLLPPDVDWSSLAVSLREERWQDVPGKFDLAPAPPAATEDGGAVILDWGDSVAPEEIRDGRRTDLYQSNDPYPADPLVIRSQGAYRQWNILTIEYWPLSYCPASKRLRRLGAAKVELRFARRSGSIGLTGAMPGRSALWDKIKGELVNPEAESEFYPTAKNTAAPKPSSTNDYVIITTSTIEQNSSQLANFVAAKLAHGHTVKVVTEGSSEDDTHYLSGGSANARADNVRNWLVNHYLGEGIEYALLIGNPHPSDFNASISVPMKMCWPRYGQSSYREAPTDFYYGDLTGNWDVNENGWYGEQADAITPGGIDRISEVVVGRIPFYGSYGDLDSILSKSISHMQGVGQSWRESLLVASAVSNFSPEDHNGDGDVTDSGEWSGSFRRTFGADWGDALVSAATGSGIAPHTLYERSGVYSDGSAYPLNSCDTALTKSNFIAQWQQHYGFVTWWGHGSTSGVYRLLWNHDGASPNPGDRITQRPGETSSSSFFTSSDCGQLSDGYPSYVVQVSCYNGYPENSGNLSYALLKQGAVGAIGSSRVSWYAVGSWNTGMGGMCGDNASYGYHLFTHMAEDADTVGAALAACRADFGLYWSSGSSWMNCCDFNLYGDPSQTLVAVEPPNEAPYTPSAPAPADGATNQPVDSSLSWSGGDPDGGDAVTYDVYLEADNSQPSVLVDATLAITLCDPGTLAKNSHYYWRVVSTDSHEAVTEGPVWDFHTEDNFAPSVHDVSPAAGCGYSGVRQTFTTSCSDPNGWQDVKWLSFAVGQDQSGSDGLLAYYSQNSDRVYLSDEEGSGWIGGFAPGSAQIIENSRVALHLEDTSAAGEGDLLTVEWSVAFKSGVPGNKHSYTKVTDDDDVCTGWQELGHWSVVNPVPVVTGWNLVSIPVTPASTAVADVLSTIDGHYDTVHAFDTQTETWLTYQVGAPPEANTLTEIDETMGFWIRATDSADLMPPGCVPTSTDTPMHVGWNLVGYPSYTARPVTETLSSIAGLYDMVCAFEPLDSADPWKRYDSNVAAEFNDLGEMGPAGGHWVRMLEDCHWICDGGESQSHSGSAKVQDGESSIREALLSQPPRRPD